MGCDCVNQSYPNYYRYSIFFFFFSAAFWALFVLGLEFTQDRVSSDKTTSTPYFFPSAVTGALLFVELILTLLISCITRNNPSSFIWNTKAEKILLIFKITNYLAIVWSIVGASISGTNGICTNYGKVPENEEDMADYRCYYDYNLAANRTVAIVTVVLHVISAVVHLILGMTDGYSDSSAGPLISCKRKRKKVGTTSTISRPYGVDLKIKKATPNPPAPQPPQAFQLASSSSSSDTETGYVHLEPRKIKLSKRSSQTRPTSAAFQEAGRKFRQLTRHTSLFTVKAGKDDSAIRNSATRDDGPPIPPPPPIRKPSGQARLTRRGRENDDERQGQATPQALKQRVNYVVTTIQQKMNNRDQTPPPKYDDVLSSNEAQYPVYVGPNPYHLPPPPEYGDPDNYGAPDNMYSGSAFPDHYLVARHPSDFKSDSKR